MSATLPVRTRFAPSPTGFLHLGGARTALFSWAYARHHQGQFVLRIEDTDLERSTPEAVQAILDGMHWLDLDYDEGPFYQMQHMPRYKEVVQQLLASGHAYYCYSSPEEVEAMRELAVKEGRKPRYDGTWRPEEGKVLPPIPADRKPVVRFKTPTEGVVTWHDLVKGSITIANAELDDLIIARPDGTPTYNFCVVVDDWDMRISHVIRGDDHINNTPRQINILNALGATIPEYGHLPMILGPDGQKLSKRHGAVSVMAYDDEGYLPEAMINYLARLGWGHGDDEIFSREQFVEWFHEANLSKSASQWDPKKLNWINAHYIKQKPSSDLARLVEPRVQKRGGALVDNFIDVVALLQERSETLEQLADDAMLFCREFSWQDADPELIETHLAEESRVLLRDFAHRLTSIDWSKEAVAQLLKDILEAHQVKMPKLGVPLRVALTGKTQTPSIDVFLLLLGREKILKRLQGI